MKFSKKIWQPLLALLVTANVDAQDIHFSQFYETSILRNPALTGVFTGDYKIGAMYRTQLSSVSKPFQTAVVSGETRIAMGRGDVSDYLSFGLLAYYDRAGSAGSQAVGIYPAVNYNKSLEDEHNSFLSVGFTGGFVQRSVDPSKMTFDNQYQNNAYSAYNPTGENMINPNFNYWDVGAGIAYSGSTASDSRYGITYYLGAAGYHFTRPRMSFMNNNAITLGIKWNGTAGMSMALNENYNFQFHAAYMPQGGYYNQVIAGGLLGWNKMDYDEQVAFALFGGIFYRFNDALIPTMKLKYKDYAFAMSYDVNVSSLNKASNMKGGFEISAFKTGLFTDPNAHKSKTICPHSFW